MKASEIHQKLKTKFEDAILQMHSEGPNPWIEVQAEKIQEICHFLKTESDLAFDFLRSIAAVDRIESQKFEVNYLLFSYSNRHEITIKVHISREMPRIKTVEGVWPAANWHERESFDLFGIEFEGHSDLRRLLMPEDWVGFPLRKDYKEGTDYRGVGTSRGYLTGSPSLPTHEPFMNISPMIKKVRTPS